MADTNGPAGATFDAAQPASMSTASRTPTTTWARHGLNCNTIAPGYMRTPLNEPLWSNPEFNEWLERRTPAGRFRRSGPGTRTT